MIIIIDHYLFLNPLIVSSIIVIDSQLLTVNKKLTINVFYSIINFRSTNYTNKWILIN